MVSFEVLLDGRPAARRRPAGGPGFAAPYSLTGSVTLRLRAAADFLCRLITRETGAGGLNPKEPRFVPRRGVARGGGGERRMRSASRFLPRAGKSDACKSAVSLHALKQRRAAGGVGDRSSCLWPRPEIIHQRLLTARARRAPATATLRKSAGTRPTCISATPLSSCYASDANMRPYSDRSRA